MIVEHEVVPMFRKGHSCKGKDWDRFLQQQKELMDDYASRGWRLASAVGISQGPHNMNSTFVGVLLYFSRESTH